MKAFIILLAIGSLVSSMASAQDCESQLRLFKQSIKTLKTTLDKGDTTQADWQNSIDATDNFFKSIETVCSSNRQLVTTTQFLKQRWIKLLSEVRQAPFISSIQEITDRYISFFDQAQLLAVTPFTDPDFIKKTVDTVIKRNLDSTMKPVKGNIQTLKTNLAKVDSTVDVMLATLESKTTSILLKTDSVSRKSDTIKMHIDIIQNRVAVIDSLLQFHAVAKVHFATLSALADGLYGVGYTRILFKNKKLLFPYTYGGEILFPVNSRNIKSPGGFIFGGFYYKRLVLQAGLGYLNNGGYQNVSWKGSIDFLSDIIGLGLSYSPLTGTGIRISYRFLKFLK